MSDEIQAQSERVKRIEELGKICEVCQGLADEYRSAADILWYTITDEERATCSYVPESWEAR